MLCSSKLHAANRGHPGAVLPASSGQVRKLAIVALATAALVTVSAAMLITSQANGRERTKPASTTGEIVVRLPMVCPDVTGPAAIQ